MGAVWVLPYVRWLPPERLHAVYTARLCCVRMQQLYPACRLSSLPSAGVWLRVQIDVLSLPTEPGQPSKILGSSHKESTSSHTAHPWHFIIYRAFK